MNKSASNIIEIISKDKQQDLSKTKKLFYKLIKQIDSKKQEILSWKDTVVKYKEKYNIEFLPLETELEKAREKMIYLLDKVYKNTAFSKKERLKIADIICNLAPDLILANENERLKKIYDKYSGSSFEDEKQEMQDQIKGMFKDILDVDLEEDLDLSSPEALFAKIAQQLKQQEQKFTQAKPQPKKSAKALAKEAAQKQAEQEVSMSIKAVYRQLATALHPDKEQDPQERERKTALMQRVNVAYNEKDLLSLLELQLEVEQINQAAINNMPEERIKHYNRVLTDQVFELKQEILGIKQAMCIQFSTLAKFNNLIDKIFTPNRIMSDLDFEVLKINKVVKEINYDLVSFANIQNIKDFLKSGVID